MPEKFRLAEKYLRETFTISLYIKGVIAFLETAAGIALYFIHTSYILSIINDFTVDALRGDTNDILAEYVKTIGTNFSVSSQYYIVLYLLSHGLIKLVLVIALLKRKMWAYPSAIGVFTLFILYQIHSLLQELSTIMIVLTILDVIVIWLTWHEYSYMKKHKITKIPSNI